MKMVLVAYNDNSSPEEAVKVVTRMITSDRVNCIVGSLHSGNILASAPVVEKYKIPEIGIGTSPSWLQKGYTYLFRPPGQHGRHRRTDRKDDQRPEIQEGWGAGQVG